MIDVTTLFWVGTIGMAAGTAAFVWSGLTSARESLRYYLVLTAISGIAAVAYALMALEIGWFTVGARDATVFIPRYVDWLLTTPLLLLYLGMLAGATRGELVALTVLDVVMIVAGFVGAILPGVERYVPFAAGALAFLAIVYLLLRRVTERAEDRATESLFHSLRNLTVVLWLVYPLVWLLGPPGIGVLTELVDVMLITYLDLITKVGFGLIALNASAVLREELDIASSESPALD